MEDTEERPNLFSYATSELSQDAFLAWLARWADPKFREVDCSLHEVGQAFVRALVGKINAADKDKVSIPSIETVRANLREVAGKIGSWATTPIREDWCQDQWRGLFASLQRAHYEDPRARKQANSTDPLDAGGQPDWSYVHNQKNGFMAFWYPPLESRHLTPHGIYLQLENEKLCVKIDVSDKAFQSPLRNKWHAHIINPKRCDTAADTADFARPESFGKGRTMTVAVVQEWRQADAANGCVDLKKTFDFLEAARETIARRVKVFPDE